MDTIFLNKDIELLIIGNLNGNEILFNQVINHCSINKRILISLGNFYPKTIINDNNFIVNKLQELQSKKLAYVIKGNHEYRYLLHSRSDNKLSWLNSLPIVLSFVFNNQSRVTVVHGGISPKCTWSESLTEMMYLNLIDTSGNPIAKKGIPWYDLYDGRFGYVVSSYLPHTKIQYYKHSCNINCTNSEILFGLVFSNGRIKNVIEFRV
jgi:hypothetical protein